MQEFRPDKSQGGYTEYGAQVLLINPFLEPVHIDLYMKSFICNPTILPAYLILNKLKRTFRVTQFYFVSV